MQVLRSSINTLGGQQKNKRQRAIRTVIVHYRMQVLLYSEIHSSHNPPDNSPKGNYTK